MRRALVALVGSLLTAGYWWTVFAVVYADALFAGDRDPSRASAGDAATIWVSLGVIGGAVVVYALLSLGWQQLLRRERPSSDG